MKALVTGANGFVGSYLTEQLLSDGWNVRVFVRKTSNLRWIKGLSVEYAYGDLAKNEGIDEALADIDVVFHVAGVVRALNREGYIAGNYLATKNLYVASEKAGVKRFVLLSSRAAVGPSPPTTRIPEDYPAPPISNYGISKRMAEDFLRERRTVPFVVLRPVAVYGPRDYGVYKFFQLIKNHLNIYIGKGTYVSMIHVLDLVDAIVKAADKGRDGEAYFVCGERDLHVRDWGIFLAELLGISPLLNIRIPRWIAMLTAYVAHFLARLIGKPTFVNPDKIRELTATGWLCSNEKAKNDLEWRPNIDEKEGFLSTFEWYIRNGWL